MSKNILITGIGGDIGQGVIKCLKESGQEYFLVGCDIDPYAAGRGDVEKFITAPKATELKQYAEFIKEVTEKYKIKYIYPTVEQEIVYFDKNREYFDNNNIKVFINNTFIINTFLDKFKTIGFLKNNALLYPPTYLAGAFDNQLNFPLIVKPRKGCGSQGVTTVYNQDQLNLFKKIIPDAIIQECLGMDDVEEYTTGVFSDGKDIQSITFLRRLGFNGISKLVILVNDKEIAGIANKIARNCNLTGSINIQSKKTENGFVVFEINPRLSSTLYTRHFFGFQDVKWHLDVVEGRDVRYMPKYNKGVGVRKLTEVFFDLK